MFDQIQRRELERFYILGIAVKLSQGHHGGVGLISEEQKVSWSYPNTRSASADSHMNVTIAAFQLCRPFLPKTSS